jgi:Na+/H+-dicarboxylate symporter
MSEVRAITNLIGNAVATVAIARWDKALDLDRARRVLDTHGETEIVLPPPIATPAAE